MKKHQEEFRVTSMCRVLESSRSGYYRWLKGLESQRVREDRKLRVEIRAVYRRSRGRYGSPRVHRALQQQGLRCGEHRVARLMKEEELQARRDRRFKVTTRSVSGRRVASNRLNQEFSVAHLDTVWGGDITYLWTREGWLYLAVLLDWSCSDRLSSPLVESALEKALQLRRPAPGLLHHSDQGGQYTSLDYQAALAARGVQVSMSRRGNCYDNAMVESFFSTLKAELEGYGHYETRRQAEAELFEYIELFYNRQRQHSSLGYRSPAEFEKAQKKRNFESNGLGMVPTPAMYP
jgi:transposase InsO family protein